MKKLKTTMTVTMEVDNELDFDAREEFRTLLEAAVRVLCIGRPISADVGDLLLLDGAKVTKTLKAWP